MTDIEKINFMGGISENNVMGILAQIERKIKFNEKILENCLEGQDEMSLGVKMKMNLIYLLDKLMII